MVYNIDRIKVNEIPKMLEIIKERTVRTEKSYWINFDRKDDPSCGFILPANSDGTPALDKMPEGAKANYFDCEANSDQYDRWFEERKQRVVAQAGGRCRCGAEVDVGADTGRTFLRCAELYGRRGQDDV